MCPLCSGSPAVSNVSLTTLQDGWSVLSVPVSDVYQDGRGWRVLHLMTDTHDLQCHAKPEYVRTQGETAMLTFHDELQFLLSHDGHRAACTGKQLRAILNLSAQPVQAPAEPSTPVRPTGGVTVTDVNRQELTRVLSDVRIEGAYMPMPHQVDAAWFKAQHGRAFDLSTMRTGKTGSSILAMEYLLRTGKVRHVMILAPLSCVRPVWADALALTLPQRVVSVVIGTKAQRLKAFKGQAEIICSNFESVALCPDEWRAFKPELVIIDECTHYANLSSKRTRAMMQFVKDTSPAYVWGLTGTPGHDPLKAFAMSKVVNPEAVACNTIRAWQDITQYRWGPQAWQWKNRPCAPECIKQALSPAVLFKKDDIFKLPPVAYIAREAQMSTQQAKLMTRLREDMYVAAESGETITAQQKASLVSKLLQCACGAVYTDTGDIMELDIASRVDEIETLIAEATGKTVIFSAFTGCIKRLTEELIKRGHKVAVVDGGTSEHMRSEVFHKFQYDPKGQSIDVLVAHPRTTAFGIELSAADMMVFDGAPLSGDFVFGQAVERLSSTKQRAKQITIAQVYACPEERKVFKALMEGQSQSAIVSALFTGSHK